MTMTSCKGCTTGDAATGKNGWCFECMEENHFLMQEFREEMDYERNQEAADARKDAEENR